MCTAWNSKGIGRSIALPIEMHLPFSQCLRLGLCIESEMLHLVQCTLLPPSSSYSTCSDSAINVLIVSCGIGALGVTMLCLLRLGKEHQIVTNLF